MPSTLNGTVPIAHRSARIEDLEDQGEFQRVLTVAMPCCGFEFGADHEDTVPGHPDRVFEPPRWTCPLCDQTYTIGALGWLEEVRP